MTNHLTLTRASVAALAFLAFVSYPAGAAESSAATTPVKEEITQTFTLDSDPYLSRFPKFLPTNSDDSGRLTQQQVRAVIECAYAVQRRLTDSDTGVSLEPCDKTADDKKLQKRDAPPQKERHRCSDGSERPPCKDTYYVLHLIRHLNGSVTNTIDDWYVYYDGWLRPKNPFDRLGDLRLNKHYAEARLYGAKRLSLVYFHYNIKASNVDLAAVAKNLYSNWLTGSNPNEPDLRNLGVEAKDKARRKANAQFLAGAPALQSIFKVPAFSNAADAANSGEASDYNALLTAVVGETTIQSATTLVSAAIGSAAGPAATDEQKVFMALAYRIVLGERDKLLAGEKSALRNSASQEVRVVASALGSANSESAVPSAFLPIMYRVEVAPKTPDYIENLRAVMGQFDLQAKVTVENLPLPDLGEMMALSAIKDGMRIDGPSNVYLTGYRGTDDKRKEIAKTKYDNESKYWFDFGFAIPLKNPRELQIDGSFPGLTAQPVEKTRIYGIVNIFPVPVDTKKAFFRFVPQFLYGMPLNSKPWESHLFGIGVGTSYFQPFAGWTYTKLQAQVPSSTDTGLRRSWKFVWGLNIQAKTVTKVIKSTTGAGNEHDTREAITEEADNSAGAQGTCHQ